MSKLCVKFFISIRVECQLKSSFSALRDEVVMSHCLIMKDVGYWSDM